jgi:hypothetical protein
MPNHDTTESKFFIHYDSGRTAPIATQDVSSREFKAAWKRLGSPYNFSVADEKGKIDYVIGFKVMSLEDYKAFITPGLQAAKKDKTNFGQRISEAVSEEWWLGIFSLKKVFKAAVDFDRPVMHQTVDYIEKMVAHFEETNTRHVYTNSNHWYGRVDKLPKDVVVLDKYLYQVYPAVSSGTPSTSSPTVP